MEVNSTVDFKEKNIEKLKERYEANKKELEAAKRIKNYYLSIYNARKSGTYSDFDVAESKNVFSNYFSKFKDLDRQNDFLNSMLFSALT